MRRRHYGWWTLALLVLLAAAVPAAYFLRPAIHRWRTLAALDSDEPAARERALNYVIQHAPKDPRVRRGALAHLTTENDAHFAQLVAALDTAALWRRSDVGDDAWLRWIAQLAASDDPEARIGAAQRTADLADLVDDERPAAIAARLAGDADPDVRYNALIAAGELAGAAKDDALDLNAIMSLAHDPEPAIARNAWIMLGLLEPASGLTADWRAAPPVVAQALLWAAVRTNPRAPLPALEALGDPAKRDAAAYALAFSEAPEAKAALLAVVQTPPQTIDPSNQLVIWRAVLGCEKPDFDRDAYTPLEEAFSEVMMDMGPNPWADPIALAATYRGGIEGAMRVSDDRYYFEKAMLATVEGQTPPWQHWPLYDPRKSPLLRVQTIAVSASPQLQFLSDVFAGDDAALRDLACVVAAEMFSREQLDPVVRELVASLDDDAKMSGAVLAGMTGLHLDLLAQREASEDVFRVRMVQRLGLWLAGRMDLDAGALLLRDDLPRTTVLLTMLHKGEPDFGELNRAAALDHLLNPRGEVGGEVLDLLVHRRWWGVLQRYLPDDAPPLWLWADPSLQQFQLDVLRCWWLLHRNDEGIVHGKTRKDRIPDP